jgi:hypothetical protein
MSNSNAGPDPILLTLFANRFMSVAEAMGKSLRQVSNRDNRLLSPDIMQFHITMFNSLYHE